MGMRGVDHCIRVRVWFCYVGSVIRFVRAVPHRDTGCQMHARQFDFQVLGIGLENDTIMAHSYDGA